jgi:hypothetical protein
MYYIGKSIILNSIAMLFYVFGIFVRNNLAALASDRGKNKTRNFD